METTWVNIWPVDLSELKTDQLEMEKVLSDGEKLRAGKYVKTLDALRYKTVRYTVKQILATYLHSPASSIHIEKDINGKPYLKDPVETDLHFNISHSGDLLLVAVSNQSCIGVDVEQVLDHRGIDELLSFCFTEQERQLVNRAKNKKDRMNKLFELWTIKEAYVKALGKGLTNQPMQELDVSRIAVPGTSGVNDIDREFTIQAIELKGEPHYKAAFAVKAKNVQVSFCKYEES